MVLSWISFYFMSAYDIWGITFHRHNIYLHCYADPLQLYIQIEHQTTDVLYIMTYMPISRTACPKTCSGKTPSWRSL